MDILKDITTKIPKFKIGNLVIHKYTGCLYSIGAFRLIENEYWYALHGYDYLISEYLLVPYEKNKNYELCKNCDVDYPSCNRCLGV